LTGGRKNGGKPPLANGEDAALLDLCEVDGNVSALGFQGGGQDDLMDVGRYDRRRGVQVELNLGFLVLRRQERALRGLERQILDVNVL
jgi:hypothetical protein